MNDISKNLKKGTIGELLVQLRLLQENIQASAPLKDTGNDLIAIKKEIIKTIQVKTTEKDLFRLKKLPRLYNLLALVKLCGENKTIHLDDCQIFILRKEDVKNKKSFNISELSQYNITSDYLNSLFSK